MPQAPAPLADWQQWLSALLEEHRLMTKADIAAQMEQLCMSLRSDHLQVAFNPADVLRSQANMDGKQTPPRTPREDAPLLTPDSSPRGKKTIPHETANGIESVKLQLPPRVTAVTNTSCRVSQFEEHAQRKGSKNSCLTDDRVRDLLLAAKSEPTCPQTTDEKDHAPYSIINMLDIFISVVININLLFMLVEIEYQSYITQVSLDMTTSSRRWNNAQTWFDAIEQMFNAIFWVEVIIRFWKTRLAYFKSVMNMVDLALVISTSLQMYVMAALDLDTGGQLTVFRFLRFIRFLRLAKVLHLQVFTELRVLVQTCISSLRALMWSIVLLAVIIVISGIFLCNLLNGFMQDDSNNKRWRLWLYRYYGSSLRATYTLFEVTMAGCWPQYFRPLVEEVSGWYAVFVLLYISFVVFAVIRIITALFLKQTLLAADNDADMVIVEQRAQTKRCIRRFEKVFQALDVNADGKLEWHELQTIISNQEVRGWLGMLEIPVHDIEALYHLLDRGEGFIAYDEFLNGMWKLRGQARSLDMIAVAQQCEKINTRLVEVETHCEWLMESFEVLGHCVNDVSTPSRAF